MPPAPSNASPARPDVTALILAAGSGTRLGGIAKATLDYQGGSLLCHALALVAPFAAYVVVGVRPEEIEWAREQCAQGEFGCEITCLTGGDTRQASLERLLGAANTPYVIVHEVARPWVDAEAFRRLLEALEENSGVALFTPLPVRDGLALIENGWVQASLPRSSVVAVQTPQVYRRAALERAYARAAASGWCEESTVALMSHAGERVRLIEGSAQNVKVTYPEDLAPLRVINHSDPGRQRASG